MRAVHGVAGLERDDLAPALLAKPPAQFRRRIAQQLEVVVHRRLDAAQLAAHVDRPGAMLQEIDPGVMLVVGAEDAPRLGGLVGLPAVADLHGRDQHALRIAERDVIAILEPGGELAAHVEVDRDRPDDARGQPHVLQHRVVFAAVEVPVERREGAVQQQLEVAELPRAQVPVGVVARRGLFLLGGRLGEIEFLQRAAVRLLVCPHLFPRRWRIACSGRAVARRGGLSLDDGG